MLIRPPPSKHSISSIKCLLKIQVCLSRTPCQHVEAPGVREENGEIEGWMQAFCGRRMMFHGIANFVSINFPGKLSLLRKTLNLPRRVYNQTKNLKSVYAYHREFVA
jgi:hypothetical protein